MGKWQQVGDKDGPVAFEFYEDTFRTLPPEEEVWLDGDKIKLMYLN